jgi:hypothetical protein
LSGFIHLSKHHTTGPVRLGHWEEYGAKAFVVVPILLTVIEKTKGQPDADALRFYAAEAIKKLAGEMDVLLPLACRHS